MLSMNYRLGRTTDEQTARQVSFSFNEIELFGYEGEPIAAALMASGIRTIRNCEVSAEPRGIFCGIGHCFECRAVVDGVPNVRTCLTPLRQGARICSKSSWQIGESYK